MTIQDNPLKQIMAPASVGIVGASNNPSKMGTMQLMNMVFCPFPGEVLPVHPKEETVFGVKAYKNILDLPYAPELALLVVPTALAPRMLDDFGTLGTRRAIIITAGFSETGANGKKLEKELLDIAHKHGIRFLGPNCMGVMHAGHPFNATVAPFADKPGHLSLASQSGTYLAQVVSYLRDRGVGMRQGISMGNEADIDLVDCLEYLAEDEGTRAIGCYIESLKDAGRFLEAARRITRTKPIVAQYVGGTEAGARSGASHTAHMAGPDDVYDGLFDQAGVIRVSTIEEVFRVGNALATQPPLKGKRIAVLTHSGGPGTAMASRGDMEGLTIRPLPEDVQEKLQAIIPPMASAKNPVDLTFVMDADLLNKHVPKILMECDEVDGVLLHGVMDTGWGEIAAPMLSRAFKVSEEEVMGFFKSDVKDLVAMPQKYNKPLICSSFMGTVDQGVSSLMKGGIPTFDGPEKAAHAMGCLAKHLEVRSRPVEEIFAWEKPGKAAEILQRSNPTGLDEASAKELLRAYGIPTCEERTARTAGEAVEAAKELGFPVVVKACGVHIQHKTEKGLVRLSLRDAEAVRKAGEEILAIEPEAGLLVCKMESIDREFLAGVAKHPGFPPSVAFGLGGIFAEAMDRIVWRAAPLTRFDAVSAIKKSPAGKLLGAFRGMEPVDVEALAQMLVNLGRLALDYPKIAEIDINPIGIAGGKPMALDALVVLE